MYNLNHIFGKEDEKDIPNYEIKRIKEWYSNIELNNIEEETIDPFEEKKDIKYEIPENNPFENISHKNIYSSGMIKCSHWDFAKWNGVMYLGDLVNKSDIKIGFFYSTKIYLVKEDYKKHN